MADPNAHLTPCRVCRGYLEYCNHWRESGYQPQQPQQAPVVVAAPLIISGLRCKICNEFVEVCKHEQGPAFRPPGGYAPPVGPLLDPHAVMPTMQGEMHIVEHPYAEIVRSGAGQKLYTLIASFKADDPAHALSFHARHTRRTCGDWVAELNYAELMARPSKLGDFLAANYLTEPYLPVLLDHGRSKFYYGEPAKVELAKFAHIFTGDSTAIPIDTEQRGLASSMETVGAWQDQVPNQTRSGAPVPQMATIPAGKKADLGMLEAYLKMREESDPGRAIAARGGPSAAAMEFLRQSGQSQTGQ